MFYCPGRFAKNIRILNAFYIQIVLPTYAAIHYLVRIDLNVKSYYVFSSLLPPPPPHPT